MKTFISTKVARWISIILLLALANNTFAASAYNEFKSAIRIPGGTPVILELNQFIDSEHGYSQNQVHFRVKYDVLVDNKVVIAKGGIAYGHIVRLEKRRGLGQPGYLEIKVDHVTAVDGTQVTLSSASLRAEGEDRDGVAIGLGVGMCCVIGPFGLLFLLIKGGPAELNPGTELNATTLYDIEVNIL